jgi:NAD(P)H-hydrate epimerase
MNLYTIAQTEQIEKAVIAAGVSELLLMKRAGWSAFALAQRQFSSARRVYVLCGGGNNGGDGFAFAQYAHLAGWQVEVGLVVSPSQVKSGAATAMLSELVALGIMPKPYQPQSVAQADLVVDALFGIGLRGHISAELSAVIASVNAFAKPVLALDVPSGLNADSGLHHGDAIQAKHTITFITYKPGLVSVDGPDLAGKVTFESLGIDVTAFADIKPVSKIMDIASLDAAMAPRKKNSHKGHFGQVLIAGGDEGMMGSVTLAAQACAHAGAGIVRVVTRSEHAPWITMTCPEVMAYGDRQMRDLVERSSVLAIGPGMTKTPWSQSLWRSALVADQPMVVDAGALRLLADQPQFRENWVLTPHPGEAAAMLGITTESVQADRLAAIVQLQAKYGGVVVLKGNGTLVYDGLDAQICDFADGSVSTAGMGDVLSGIIAALMAQGLTLMQSAVQGVTMHAKAGQKLAEQSRVVLASDVVNSLVT